MMRRTNTAHPVCLFIVSLLLSLVLASSVEARQTVPVENSEDLKGVTLIHKFDARTVSLGNAAVADAAGLGSVNINPGLLSMVRNLKAVELQNHQNWENNLISTTLALPGVEIGQNRALLQLGYHGRGLERSILNGSATRPVPSLSLYQADLTYAYSFSNIVSIGLMQRVSYAENRHARFWTYNTGLGVLYAPSESISYGLVYRGLGRSVSYEIIEDGRTTLGSHRLRESLELGATLTYPVDTDQTYMAISLSNEKRFGEPGIWYKAGGEFNVNSVLYLRSGVLFNSESYIVEPRFGLGLRFGRFMVDYALSHKEHEIDRFHQLGLKIQL